MLYEIHIPNFCANSQFILSQRLACLDSSNLALRHVLNNVTQGGGELQVHYHNKVITTFTAEFVLVHARNWECSWGRNANLKMFAANTGNQHISPRFQSHTFSVSRDKLRMDVDAINETVDTKKHLFLYSFFYNIIYYSGREAPSLKITHCLWRTRLSA